MRILVLLIFVLTSIIGMSSCSIDDSNDIEVIKPGDTVITGNSMAKKLI